MSKLQSVILALATFSALPHKVAGQAFNSVITQHSSNAFGVKRQSFISYRSIRGEVAGAEQIRIMGGTPGGIALAVGEAFRVAAPAAGATISSGCFLVRRRTGRKAH
jgi:hypothetical protein